MDTIEITAEDIAEILEKKHNIKNPFKSIDGLTKEDINNIIIETEISKFNKTFNRIFEENLLPEEEEKEEAEDSEDGPISEIGIKVIEELKESFKKIDKEKLLKLLFKLITKLVFGNNEEN